MKVPKAKRSTAGKWFIQLRLGGESIYVNADTEKECIRQAQYAKAEYLSGKRISKQKAKDTPTLSEAIDKYILVRQNILSPSTINGYRCIQKTRFKHIMHRKIGEIDETEWQSIVNEEAALCSQKTLKNAFAFIRGVIKNETGNNLPQIQLGVPVPNNIAFLQPEEILIFIPAIIETKYGLAALLALSSMRMSEIWALRWEDIPKDPDFIHCSGAVVRNEHNQMTRKKQNKNETSSRYIPIVIPELKILLEKERRSSGPVVRYSQVSFRKAIHEVCRQKAITDITPHGLRHSYASLCYHLKIDKQYVKKTGGWKNDGTLERVYTHIAKSDITLSQNKLFDFYNKKENEK